MNYTPVFTANKNAYEAHKYRRIINQGSTRSSKTYSICQLLALICRDNKKSVSIVSPSLPHLKRGARRDFLNILYEWQFFREDWFNRTDNIFNFPSGAYVEFFGADDPGKVHGVSRDILYVNEANLLTHLIYT